MAERIILGATLIGTIGAGLFLARNGATPSNAAIVRNVLRSPDVSGDETRLQKIHALTGEQIHKLSATERQRLLLGLDPSERAALQARFDKHSIG